MRPSPSNLLLALWQHLKTSLWFVPSLMALGAAVLARVAVTWNLDITADGEVTWWLHSGNAADAAELMGKLMSSLIGMLALVASLTMVVLTLAASQLGPRLIRIFMADRRTQVVLGLFVATVVYLLLVLRTINSEMSFEAVPHLAVTLGSAASLMCLFVLLFFMHHLARSVVSDTVIAQVGRDLDEQIRAMLPQNGGDDQDAPEQGGPGAPVSLERCGYVEAIDYAALVRAATVGGAVLAVEVRPGDHVVKDTDQVVVRPAAALTDELRERICAAVLVSNERTPTQDIEYAIRQLVEIALRALSPSLNDPFTAVAVLDRLAESLGRVMRRGSEVAVHRDLSGDVRVLAARLDFADFAAAAFDQIRHAARDKPDVLARMLDVLVELAYQARTPGHRRVVGGHGALVLAAARRNIAEPADLARVEARQRALLAALAEAEAG